MKMLERKFLFAEKTVLIKTNDKKLHTVLGVFFPEYASKKKPDLTLEYGFRKGNFDLSFFLLQKSWKTYEKVRENKKKKLIEFKSRKGNSKKMLVSGFLDLKKKIGKIQIVTHRNFLWNFFIFNIIKCLAIYLNKCNGTIIHSSAVVKNKQAFLFSGIDESGKTTITRLLPETETLGEDMNFLFKKGKRIFVQEFPFIKVMVDVSKRQATPFELNTVFFIKKSKKLKIKKLTKIESIAELLKNDVQGTLEFNEINGKERLSLYKEIFSCVPAYVLHFPIKNNLWKKIQKKIKQNKI